MACETCGERVRACCWGLTLCAKKIFMDLLVPDLSFEILGGLLTNVGLVSALILAAVGQFQGALSLDDQLDLSYRMCLMQNEDYRVWLNSYLLKTGFNMTIDDDPMLHGPLNISEALLAPKGFLFSVTPRVSSDLQRIDRVFHHTRSAAIPPAMKVCDSGGWNYIDKFSIAVTLCSAVTCSSALAYAALLFLRGTFSDPRARDFARKLEERAEEEEKKTKKKEKEKEPHQQKLPTELTTFEEGGNKELPKVPKEPKEPRELTPFEKYYSRCVTFPIIIALYYALVLGVIFFGWSFADFGVARQPQIAAIMTNNVLFYTLFLGLVIWSLLFSHLVPFMIAESKPLEKWEIHGPKSCDKCAGAPKSDYVSSFEPAVEPMGCENALEPVIVEETETREFKC